MALKLDGADRREGGRNSAQFPSFWAVGSKGGLTSNRKTARGSGRAGASADQPASPRGALSWGPPGGAGFSKGNGLLDPNSLLLISDGSWREILIVIIIVSFILFCPKAVESPSC